MDLVFFKFNYCYYCVFKKVISSFCAKILLHSSIFYEGAIFIDRLCQKDVSKQWIYLRHTQRENFNVKSCFNVLLKYIWLWWDSNKWALHLTLLLQGFKAIHTAPKLKYQAVLYTQGFRDIISCMLIYNYLIIGIVKQCSFSSVHIHYFLEYDHIIRAMSFMTLLREIISTTAGTLKRITNIFKFT